VKTTRTILTSALILLPTLLFAQGAKKITVDQIMEKSLAATGGRAAMLKLKTSTMKGTLNVKSSGIKGTIAITTKSPNKVLVTSTIPGVGDSLQGFDGKVGWAKDPFSGLRKLEGGELDEIKRQGQLSEALTYKSVYSQIKLVGTQKVNGKDAYVLKMTPKKGKPSTSYFDTKTFLLVKQEMTAETPQGTFPVEAFISEYKTIDGVKFPTVMKQKIGTIADMEMRFSEIKNNTPVDDKIFTMPAK